MTPTPNRFGRLIFPLLTAIGLITSYVIWLIADELWRSVYGPWLLVAIALIAGLIILRGCLKRHRLFDSALNAPP